MNNNRRPVVAHFNYPVFLPKSQTFIYQYISHLRRFYPICLSWGFDNLNQFFVPKEALCLLSYEKYSFNWFYYGIQKRFYYRVQKRYFSRDRAAEKIAAAFLRKQKAQLIHAHFGPTGVLTLRLKEELHIPQVTTFYGQDISQFAKNEKWRRLYKTLFQKGEMFLVEGPYMLSKLQALDCPEEKIRIQHIAIPVDQILFRSRKPKKKGEKAILIFAGRFVEKKGLIYALQALKEVHTKYHDFEFRIIGDGPLKDEIVEFITKNNMADYTLLLGFLNYADYLNEMQKADIFIHPSVTAANGDSEGGAPTTILEAQAMGMPVISSYHADIPNIVIDGKSALLSYERDCEGLSKNITYLLENQLKWEDMGRAGRAFIEKYHDINKEVQALEDNYAYIIDQNKQYLK